MSFREYFLNKLLEKSKTETTNNPIIADKMQAFTKRDIETAIQLYLHLRNMGNTFDDLIEFVASKQRETQKADAKSAVQSAIYLTREQRKHLKHNRVEKTRRGK